MTLRVLQVLHQGGGAGSVTSVLHLSLGLRAAGVHVRFACPPGSEVERMARQRGLEVHAVALRARAHLANARALRDLLARAPVDLVSSQSARDRQALVGLALARCLPVPLVVTRRQMPRTVSLVSWTTSRVAARVVAVSGAVARALVRRGTPPAKVLVIHNGLVTERVDTPVPPAAVACWRERIGWSPDRPTLGIVSRPKDQAVVLAALERITTPLTLVLAGAGGDPELALLAAAGPSRHHVVLLPFDSDIRPLYELLDIALLPSRMEGLSQALLEAMALGTPVIASDAAGNPELITHGVNGMLAPPLDSRAWAAVMASLLHDRALAARLAAAASHTARETFSLRHTVRRTLALYHEILGCASPC